MTSYGGVLMSRGTEGDNGHLVHHLEGKVKTGQQQYSKFTPTHFQDGICSVKSWNEIILWVKMVATQITLGCAVFTGLSGGGGIVTPRAFLSFYRSILCCNHNT